MKIVNDDFLQEMTGAMTYPRPGTANRSIFKTPILLWRMGLGRFLGKHMLVLTTWGRKSGLPRHTMLSYYEMNGSLFVLSGWGSKADWYRNILANQAVTVQTDKDSASGLARRVEQIEEYRPVMQALLDGAGDSHFEPWLSSLDIDQNIEDLVAKRERVYLVALEPGQGSGPDPLAADLKWFWGVLLVILAGWIVIYRLKR